MSTRFPRARAAFVSIATFAAIGALSVSGVAEGLDAQAAEADHSVVKTASASAQLSAQASASAKLARNTCRRNRLAAPRCGVLWGMYLSPKPGPGEWRQPYRAMEKRIGRRFDLVKAYQPWDASQRFPTPHQKKLASKHRLYEYSWNAIVYSSRKRIHYQDIANGKYDASIIRPQARKLKRWGRKVIVDFDHEADDPGVRDGIGNAKSYKAAYRHIVRVFRKVGAKNVLWAWVTTGYDPARIKPFYPGRRYVDWIGYDPYNFSSCSGAKWKSPHQTFARYYRWVASQKKMRGKPLLLGEYATFNGPRAQKWYAGVAKALKRLPRIKAVMHFSADGLHKCDFTLTNHASALKGFKKSSRSRYVLGKH